MILTIEKGIISLNFQRNYPFFFCAESLANRVETRVFSMSVKGGRINRFKVR